VSAEPANGQRPLLVVCGWYKPGTGFTRVLDALCVAFARRAEVLWFGVGYTGPEFCLRPGVRVLPTKLTGGDWLGVYELARRWTELNPAAVLVLNDLWYLESYNRVLAPLRGDTPVVGYVPIDGRIVDIHAAQGLEGFSAIATYTEGAAQDLRGAFAELGNRVPVHVAGHGVDLDTFAPHASTSASHFDACARQVLAQQFFGADEPLFVVLNASRYDPRKRIDLSIAGFAEFARDKPSNVRLCLHHALRRPEDDAALRALVREHGIESRTFISPDDAVPWSDARLNTLYNACAVGLTTTLGEGFGLVPFEHAATGAPQVMPRHSALAEIWPGAAEFIEPARRYVPEHSPLEMGEVRAADVANALRRLYADPMRYRSLSRAALARTQSPELRWAEVAARLLPILGLG
jgi:glycosyltransferase involved in cell wall biosynthesis